MTQKKQSGIDIDLGNQCSQIAYSWAKKTFANRQNMPGAPCPGLDGAFSNVMDFNGARIGISSDGIGTKIEIAERSGIYNTIGYDLLAMVADDLVANGLEPVNLSNILDVDFLDAEIIAQLMQGLYDAANFAGVIITGGEIAELGNRIGGYGNRMHFNWCSTGVGIIPDGSDVIDGSKIQPGDVILSLKSRGFRSNGFSMIRKIMIENYGKEWHLEKYNAEKSWGEIILTPSLIYTPVIVKLIKNNFRINGIAHITGGGLPDNLSRVLKTKKLGAVLDDLFPPLEFMKKLQQLGNVTEDKAYQLWNMGNGMLIVVSEADAREFISFIEDGNYRTQIAGIIIDRPEITLRSHGCNAGVLHYQNIYS